MALTDPLPSFPSLGLLDLIQIGSALVLAGPLLIATAIFLTRGAYLMAGFTGVLAIVALYLPTYIVNRVFPDSIVPARLRNLRDWRPFGR